MTRITSSGSITISCPHNAQRGCSHKDHLRAAARCQPGRDSFCARAVARRILPVAIPALFGRADGRCHQFGWQRNLRPCEKGGYFLNRSVAAFAGITIATTGFTPAATGVCGRADPVGTRCMFQQCGSRSGKRPRGNRFCSAGDLHGHGTARTDIFQEEGEAVAGREVEPYPAHLSVGFEARVVQRPGFAINAQDHVLKKCKAANVTAAKSADFIALTYLQWRGPFAGVLPRKPGVSDSARPMEGITGPGIAFTRTVSV